MSKFIEAAIKAEPFMTCNSEGNPDPEKRRASVVLAFHGPDAFDKAHKLVAAIIADVEATTVRTKP